MREGISFCYMDEGETLWMACVSPWERSPFGQGPAPIRPGSQPLLTAVTRQAGGPRIEMVSVPQWGTAVCPIMPSVCPIMPSEGSLLDQVIVKWGFFTVGGECVLLGCPGRVNNSRGGGHRVTQRLYSSSK